MTTPPVPTDYDHHQGEALKILRDPYSIEAGSIPVAQVHATLALAAAVRDPGPVTLGEYTEPIDLVPTTSSVAEPVSAALVRLSQWIDAANDHKPAEQQAWERTAKVAEECGEVIAAMIGMTGQNPRKGFTHTREDVVAELLDVAVTALGGIEHLTGHQGTALELLDEKILAVSARAGVL